MIPREFFVTSAKAISSVSELNAFDLALKNAGIAQCNLVTVSSVLPQKCKERKWRKLPPGSITHAVIARMDGGEGTIIGAGLAWAWEKDKEYGIVAEAHGNMDHKALNEALAWKIKEMADIRGIEIGEIDFRIEVLGVPIGNYGCVIATLVYCPLDS
ncbi:MAG: pyruvoyl-dependent arginine decarboxylase [Candidatus Bathyarchaeota archaeon]|nr:MAG: pyruvoyl-dependent arginine decarboxylase [Candidatus Bathyarchaeota archaeon]